MKNFFRLIIIIFIIFGCFSFSRFAKDVYYSKEYSFKENTDFPSDDAIARFSEGLKIKTISNPSYQDTDFSEFERFIAYIQQAYPKVFEKCEFKLINNYSIILKLDGRVNNNLPNILTAHYDVVDVKNQANWKHLPFSGHFDKEYIYSRGTIDDKCSVFAILETLNNLLEEGFEPENDLYIAFSHCEETGSLEGAPKIIEYFKNNNIKFNSVLDEGGRIVNKNNNYYAFIGTGEKGRLLAKLTLHGKGSHASTPDKNMAVVKLAKLVEEFGNNTREAVISEDIEKYYKTTYQSYGYLTKFLISNMDILKPLFIWKMSEIPEENARISSTFAITMIEASNVQNAVSQDASMLIDSRIIPNETLQDIKNYINEKIEKALPNEKVTIEYLSEIEPSLSPSDSDEFKKLGETIRKIYPDIPVLPYLVLGATDAREYSKISNNTFRFLPCVLTDAEAGLMHSDNERISIKNWGRMITFYKEYILSK